MGPSNCDKMKMAFKKGSAACLQMASTVGQIKLRRADAAPSCASLLECIGSISAGKCAGTAGF